MHRPQPGSPGGLGRRLPCLDDVGQEAVAGRRALVDDLVAAVAVEPGRRTRTASTGRPGRRAAVSAMSRVPSTRESSTLSANTLAPALPDVLAGEVDDRLDVLERAVVDRAGRDVPQGLVRAGGSRRTRRTRSWPAPPSAAARAVPMSPDEPVIAIRMPKVYTKTGQEPSLNRVAR